MARLENSIPIKGFLETSFLDWPGKIASVIFLPSCNFRCPFCQNATLVLKPQHLKTWPLPEVLQRIKELKGWIDGICITGGEPTLQETLPDFIRTIQKEKSFGETRYQWKLSPHDRNPFERKFSRCHRHGC